MDAKPVSSNVIINQRIQSAINSLDSIETIKATGTLSRISGLTLEAAGCNAAIGELCKIRLNNSEYIDTEVVGFSSDKLYLMPSRDVRGLKPGCDVIPTGRYYNASLSDDLLGRIIDFTGKSLDSQSTHVGNIEMPLIPPPINPIARKQINEPIDVGIRTINSLLTVGRGQRMGLFAGSGVGKSVLLGMMTKYTNADITVVAMIGERGREVKYFTENILGKEGLKNAVVVAAPADTPPMSRVHGAYLATTIAEYFRDKGYNVLLLMDSLTRFAQAHREIALSVGEIAATKGYPPSVFSKIPQLVERAGGCEGSKGSITAFYTVLTEADDINDPVADASRAILDGHIVLSRRLAESGHYPAIDIESSISRIMNDIISEDHMKSSKHFREAYSLYMSNLDLINVGAYSKGSNTGIDKAIESYPLLKQFLQQDLHTAVNLNDSVSQLSTLMHNTGYYVN